MASLPPEPILPLADSRPVGTLAPGALVAQWEALHASAASLGKLAQIAAESTAPPFDRLVETAPPWQLTLAAQGMDDIAAMLAPGLAALGTLTARGQETAAPALALWREFHAARAGVLAALHAPATA
jgi:putative intracellular protease/amidase